jgi:hypothetical protein
MRILTIVYVLTTTMSFAQDGQQNNDDLKDKSNLYKTFGTTYDSIISYSESYFWTAHQRYTILGHKNKKWELITWDVFFIDRSFKDIKKTKKKTVKVESEQIESLNRFWTINQLWTIKPDSLNKRWMKINEDETLHMDISDGSTQKIEMIINQNYRQLTAYMPDEFQKKIFTDDRATFIKCRDYFKNRFVK